MHGEVNMSTAGKCPLMHPVWVLLASLLVLVVAGCGGSDGSSGSVAPVPDVAGFTQTAATTSINQAGLAVGTVTMQSSSTAASGEVISESPVAGTKVMIGSLVSLIVSTGPAQVAVPNVVGQTQAAATTAITG